MRVRTIIIIAVILIVSAIVIIFSDQTSSFTCKPINGLTWACNYNLRR